MRPGAVIDLGGRRLVVSDRVEEPGGAVTLIATDARLPGARGLSRGGLRTLAITVAEVDPAPECVAGPLLPLLAGLTAGGAA